MEVAGEIIAVLPGGDDGPALSFPHPNAKRPGLRQAFPQILG
jgi:hypothetical protein